MTLSRLVGAVRVTLRDILTGDRTGIEEGQEAGGRGGGLGGGLGALSVALTRGLLSLWEQRTWEGVRLCQQEDLCRDTLLPVCITKTIRSSQAPPGSLPVSRIGWYFLRGGSSLLSARHP